MPRGKAKTVDMNVTEVEHNARIREENAQRKKDNKIVSTHILLSNGKLSRCHKMTNGNVYRTYIGHSVVKKKDSEGTKANPLIAQYEKEGILVRK